MEAGATSPTVGDTIRTISETRREKSDLSSGALDWQGRQSPTLREHAPDRQGEIAVFNISFPQDRAHLQMEVVRRRDHDAVRSEVEQAPKVGPEGHPVLPGEVRGVRIETRHGYEGDLAYPTGEPGRCRVGGSRRVAVVGPPRSRPEDRVHALIAIRTRDGGRLPSDRA